MTDQPHTLVVALPVGDDPSVWIDALRERLPHLRVASLDEAGPPEAVRYVAAWKHPAGSLGGFPKLAAIFSLGAGVDHLMTDPALPDVPIVRVVNADLTNRMSEWVMLHVLMHHRQVRLYDYQQFERIWADDAMQPAAAEVRVGVMGLGVLGADAARKLRLMGFDVAGWSRSPKEVEGIASFSGEDGLGPFLARTEILVVLLPLTPATAGILDMTLFRQLARSGHVGGPVVINAGRGGLQKEADILRALEEGVLRAVTLDVFDTEPLPPASELWHHPGVTITPHNAAISAPAATADYVAGRIAAFERGEPLGDLVDRKARY